jgi:predicted metal-dependent peptidase
MTDLQKIEDCSRISVNRRIPSKLLRARLTACKVWPFSRDAILSMSGIPVKGLGTMAVDKYWRLYFDPQFVEVTEDKELAAVILHELLHLLYGHHKRGTRMMGANPSPRDRHLMNVAADAQINFLLQQEIFTGRGDWRVDNPYLDIEIGDDWILPETVEVTPNITMEETYRELQDKDAKQEKETIHPTTSSARGDGTQGGYEDDTGSSGGSNIGAESIQAGDCGASEFDEHSTVGEGEEFTDETIGNGWSNIDTGKSDPIDPQGSDSDSREDGSGADSSEAGTEPGSDSTGQLWSNSSGDLEWEGPDAPKPGTGSSGSSADGLTRPWELPEPTEENGLPGIDEDHSDSIINEVAKQLQSASAGNAGSSLTRWANKARRIHKDPREVILRVVRKRVEEHTGIGERSFRRPNRRYAHSGVIMPSNVAVVPRIAVFLDTSGSMLDEDFSLALGMINKIISSFRIRDGIVIITGDTEAKTKMHTAGQVRELKLKGGGGTDVGNIVSTGIGELKAKPHIAVAITDGMTPWPDDKNDVGVPMLAVITRPKDDGGYYQVPDWIETIYLKD